MVFTELQEAGNGNWFRQTLLMRPENKSAANIRALFYG